MSEDVVERAREAVANLEGRDEPFCVDCHDAYVGVDTDIVTELADETERLRGELAAMRTEWGWDVPGRKKPNPTIINGIDGRPATERPTLSDLAGIRIYSRQVSDWEPS